MYNLFRTANFVYTGSDEDELVAIVGLYEFAKSMGKEVVVAGKGKNIKLKIEVNPYTAREEAEMKNMNPLKLATFQDGTKTMRR